MSLAGVSRGLSQDILQDIEERNNASGGGGSFGWFKLKGHGSSAQVRFLVADEHDPNLVAVYEHSLKRNTPPFDVTCIGKDNGCPLCANGEKASLRAYFLLWNYDAEKDSEGNVRNIQVWKRGPRDITKFLSYMSEYGELSNRDYKITRQGTSMDNTQYNFFARDKSEFEFQAEADDQLENVVNGLLRLVEPKSIEDILTLASGGELPKKEEQVEPVKPVEGYNPAKPDDIPW